MKEMIYQQTRLKEPEILASGEHKGYNYYALSLGTHPCGYVEIPNNNKYFNVDYDNIPVECHGGLTYGRNYLHTVSAPDDNRYFIGWDYAHYIQLAEWLVELKKAKSIIRVCNRVLGFLLECEIENTSTRHEVETLLKNITEYLSGGNENG